MVYNCFPQRIQTNRGHYEVEKEEIEKIISNYTIAKMIEGVTVKISTTPSQAQQNICDIAEKIPNPDELDKKNIKKCKNYCLVE